MLFYSNHIILLISLYETMRPYLKWCNIISGAVELHVAAESRQIHRDSLGLYWSAEVHESENAACGPAARLRCFWVCVCVCFLSFFLFKQVPSYLIFFSKWKVCGTVCVCFSRGPWWIMFLVKLQTHCPLTCSHTHTHIQVYTLCVVRETDKTGRGDDSHLSRPLQCKDSEMGKEMMADGFKRLLLW